jgi:CRP-like cAMP-binding protein
VTLIHLSMHDIVAYAGVNPAIYGEVALIGCQHQRAALSFIETMLAKPTKARLAEMILDMAAPEPGQPAGNLVLPISQEDLAGRIGISRQHLNSLLSDLKRSGGISTSYGRIHVHDSRALLAAAR